jgi:hypothetical protein
MNTTTSIHEQLHSWSKDATFESLRKFELYLQKETDPDLHYDAECLLHLTVQDYLAPKNAEEQQQFLLAREMLKNRRRKDQVRKSIVQYTLEIEMVKINMNVLKNISNVVELEAQKDYKTTLQYEKYEREKEMEDIDAWIKEAGKMLVLKKYRIAKDDHLDLISIAGEEEKYEE